MNERVEYPYTENIGGLRFTDIYSRIHSGVDIKNGVHAGEVLGGSGSKLYYSFSSADLQFSLSDVMHPNDFFLSAKMLAANIINFELYSRRDFDELTMYGRRNRKLVVKDGRYLHPDLFAGKFVKEVLGFYARIGVDVQGWKQVYSQGTDSLAQFDGEYSRSHNALAAVSATWGGHMALENGFTEIPSEQIELVQDETVRKITATFYKPTHPQT